MVLQDCPGREGEMTDLAVDHVPGCARDGVAAAVALCRPAALLGGRVGGGAGVGGHTQEGAGLGGLAVAAAGEARGETRRHDAVTGSGGDGDLAPPGGAGRVRRVRGGRAHWGRSRRWWLLVVVVERMLCLICWWEVVSWRGGLGISTAGWREGVHGAAASHRSRRDELTGVVVGDGLAGLQAELEVGQPLLVLLPCTVNASLLAGVELSVADPAVVLESGGTHHVPEDKIVH